MVVKVVSVIVTDLPSHAAELDETQITLIVKNHDSVRDDDSLVDDKGAIGVFPPPGSVDELGIESLGELNHPELEGVQTLGEIGGEGFRGEARKGVEDTELAGVSGLNAGEPT